MTAAGDLPLELTGEPAPAPPPPNATGYLKAYRHYAQLYGRSLRCIKGWVEDGEKATPPTPPPFDEPSQMLSWWHRVKTNRPPDVLVRLAAGQPAGTAAAATPAPVDPAPDAAAATAPAATASAPAETASPPASSTPAATATPPATAAAPSIGLPLLGGPQVGFAALLNRLRIAEANQGELHASLVRDALAATDPEQKLRLQAAAERAQSKWNEMIGELRKAEADAPKILAAAGKSWDSDSVLATLEAFHLVQKSSLAGLVRRVRPMLKGCATELDQDALWQRELDAVFGMWSPEQFVARIKAS